MFAALIGKLFGSIWGKVLSGVLIAALVGGGIYLIKDAVDGYNTLVKERERFKMETERLAEEVKAKDDQITFIKNSTAITASLDQTVGNYVFNNQATLLADLPQIMKAGNHEIGIEPRCKDRVIPMPPAMSAAFEQLRRNAQGRNPDAGVQEPVAAP